MKVRFLAVSIALTLEFSATAFANPDIQMICKNPGREYFLSFKDGDRSVAINPDSTAVMLPVLAPIFDDQQYILVAKGSGSMTALIHFSPYKKVEWFDDGDLVQTDACHE